MAIAVVGVAAGYFAWAAFRTGSASRPRGHLEETPGTESGDGPGAPSGAPDAMPVVDMPAAPGVEERGVPDPGDAGPPDQPPPGPPAGGLRERSTSPWRVPDTERRQIVEVALRPVPQRGDLSLVPDMPGPPATASCEVALEGGGPVRVFDRAGRERRCRVEPVDSGDSFGLVFEATSEGGAGGDNGPFEVYYPAPGGQELPPGEGEGGVSLTVYPAKHEQVKGLMHPRAAADLARGAEPVAPPKRRAQIDDCTIPFNRFGNYLAAYRAWIACPNEGQHTFALDADDRAFVMLDGKQVLAGGRPGHLPAKPFQYRASVKLEAGLHALTFYHVQGGGALRSRLAWRPPAATKGRVVPPSAFVSHLPARAVALELRDDTACMPFFRAKVSRRLVINREVPITEWELVASGPVEAREANELRWVWREGERVLGTGDRLDVFVSGLVMPEVGVRPWRDITLALDGPDGEVARYTRRLRAKAHDPLEDEELALRLEPSAAPTFVYPHEPFEVHVRAVNESPEAVELEAVEVCVERAPRRAVARRLGAFELPGVPERGRDVIARRMNRIVRRLEAGECSRLERVVFLIGPPGAPAVPLTFEVLGSRERDMPALSAEGGALLLRHARARPAEAGGVLVPPRLARALFVLPFDSEDELRKWGMLDSISLGGGSGKALLCGDALASPGAEGGEGLGPRMSASLDRSGTELQARPFGSGAYPIHAACASAADEFSRRRWETIYVSLGLADCRAGTPVREFERGVDFLIDRASVHAPQARLVVVGPPLEWTREGISDRYADAAREIVERHRIPYVDVRALMESPGLSGTPGTDRREAGPDDGVRFPYPIGPAMDAIAAEVLSR